MVLRIEYVNIKWRVCVTPKVLFWCSSLDFAFNAEPVENYVAIIDSNKMTIFFCVQYFMIFNCIYWPYIWQFGSIFWTPFYDQVFFNRLFHLLSRFIYLQFETQLLNGVR